MTDSLAAEANAVCATQFIQRIVTRTYGDQSTAGRRENFAKRNKSVMEIEQTPTNDRPQLPVTHQKDISTQSRTHRARPDTLNAMG